MFQFVSESGDIFVSIKSLHWLHFVCGSLRRMLCAIFILPLLMKGHAGLFGFFADFDFHLFVDWLVSIPLCVCCLQPPASQPSPHPPPHNPMMGQNQVSTTADTTLAELSESCSCSLYRYCALIFFPVNTLPHCTKLLVQVCSSLCSICLVQKLHHCFISCVCRYLSCLL